MYVREQISLTIVKMTQSAQEVDVATVFATSVPIFEEDFLATIPMPPDPPDPGIDIAPTPLKQEQSVLVPEVPPRRESRWDRNDTPLVSPPTKKEEQPQPQSNGLPWMPFKTGGNTPDSFRSPPKTSSPTVILAKGMRRGQCNNLGFRISYHGLGLQLPASSTLKEDYSDLLPHSDGVFSTFHHKSSMFSHDSKEASDDEKSDRSIDDLRSPTNGESFVNSCDATDLAWTEQQLGNVSLNGSSEADVVQFDIEKSSHSPDASPSSKLQEHSSGSESNSEPSVNGDCASTVHGSTSKAKFGKFKFLTSSVSSAGGVFVNTEDNCRTGGGSEDSDSGTLASSVVNSEAEESSTVPVDHHAEDACSSEIQQGISEESTPPPPPPPLKSGGRRRRGGSGTRGVVEEPPGGRRRSSRIRSMEERREREREEKLRGAQVKEEKTPDSNVASPVSLESSDVAGPSLDCETVISEVTCPSPSKEETEIILDQIPLPPMPPPGAVLCYDSRELQEMDCSASNSQFVVPIPPIPAPLTSPSGGHSTSPRASNSPQSSDETSASNRPEKVKSRWRRSSEMEGVGAVPGPRAAYLLASLTTSPVEGHSSRYCSSTATPPSHQVLSTVPQPVASPLTPQVTPLPPSSPTSADAVVAPPAPSLSSSVSPSASCPDATPPSVVTCQENTEIQLPPHLSRLSIAPTGFFSPGEITEDWSEKDVITSLTQNPLPLRLRPVPVASSETESKHAKSVTVPPKDRPPYLNFEEVVENVFYSER